MKNVCFKIIYNLNGEFSTFKPLKLQIFIKRVNFSDMSIQMSCFACENYNSLDLVVGEPKGSNHRACGHSWPLGHKPKKGLRDGSQLPWVASAAVRFASHRRSGMLDDLRQCVQETREPLSWGGC